MAETHQKDDSGTPERQMAGREIADSLARAQTALNRYDHTRKRLAARGLNPENHPETRRTLITLDAAVHDAYTKLRKYIRGDLESDWWNTKILGWADEHTPIVLGGDTGESIEINDEEFEVNGEAQPDDVRFIEEYAGEVIKEKREEYVRFEGYQTNTIIRPSLMPVSAYRRAIRYLDEIRNELGFAPESRRKTPRTEINDDMMEDLETWREQNLPEEVLHGDE